jgi:hypothetical protein
MGGEWMRCPVCHGKFERKEVDYACGGISLGTFEADICQQCSIEFFTAEASFEIDDRARERGIWGFGVDPSKHYAGDTVRWDLPGNVNVLPGIGCGEVPGHDRRSS